MKFDHQAASHHVAVRDGLPVAIRPTLLEQTRSEWENHPRFAGKARFFMHIHRQLLNGTRGLVTLLESILQDPNSAVSDATADGRLVQGGLGLISFAHGHHEIEDRGYFPQFARLYPGLDRALSLLDWDHKVLAETLDGTSSALNNLSGGNVSIDNIARLHAQVSALDRIFSRHIKDEEEVIIPIFLRH